MGKVCFLDHDLEDATSPLSQDLCDTLDVLILEDQVFLSGHRSDNQGHELFVEKEISLHLYAAVLDHPVQEVRAYELDEHVRSLQHLHNTRHILRAHADFLLREYYFQPV